MKIIKLPILLIALVTVLSSCKKDPDNSSHAYSKELFDFFKNNQPQKQIYTIPIDAGFNLEGQKGTRLYIPSGAFKDSNGQIVTGNVTIELVEIYSKKDMFLSGATPISNGHLLISGGELYINATQNGNQLTLVPNTIYVYSAGATGATGGNMQLFTASGQAGVDSTGGNSLNWILSDSSVVSTSDTINSLDTIRYCYSLLPDLGWVNYDYFAEWPNTDTIKAQYPDMFNQYNTVSFVSFDGMNLGLYLSSPSFTSTITSLFQSYFLAPMGVPVHIVSISYENGQYYYTAEAGTTASGIVFHPVPVAMSQANILAALATLP